MKHGNVEPCSTVEIQQQGMELTEHSKTPDTTLCITRHVQVHGIGQQGDGRGETNEQGRLAIIQSLDGQDNSITRLQAVICLSPTEMILRGLPC